MSQPDKPDISRLLDPSDLVQTSTPSPAQERPAQESRLFERGAQAGQGQGRLFRYHHGGRALGARPADAGLNEPEEAGMAAI